MSNNDRIWESNIKERIVEKLRTEYEESVSTDTVIKIGDVTFLCHKVVLEAASSYFTDMFSTEFHKNDKNEIELKAISSETFSQILDFLYCKENHISDETIEAITQAAMILQIDCIKTECTSFMEGNISTNNAAKYWNLARKTQLENIESLREFILSHFADVFTCTDFLYLEKSDLRDFVLDDTLRPSSEDIVFEAVLRWIEHDFINRKNFTDEILPFIRFPLMDSEYLVNITKRHPYLLQNQTFNNLLQEACEYHMTGNRRFELTTVRTKHRSTSDRVHSVLAISKKSERGFTDLRFKILTLLLNLESGKWKSISLDSLFLSEDEIFGACISYNKLHIIMMAGKTESFDLSQPRLVKDYRTTFGSRLLLARRENVLIATGKYLYTIGGIEAETNEVISSIERFDTETYSWNSTEYSKLTIPVCEMSGVVFSQRIYIFGGRTDECDRTTAAQCFDPVTRKCEIVGDLPKAVSVSGALMVNDSVYLAANDGTLMKVEIAPENKLDTTVCGTFQNFEVKRIALFRIDNRLYAVEALAHGKRCKDIHYFDLDSREFERDTELTYPDFDEGFVTLVPVIVQRNKMTYW